MNTPQGNTAERVKAPYSVEFLDQQERIANTENFTAMMNLQTARISYQTAMISILDTEQADDWVMKLEEENQQKEDARRENTERYESGEISLKESLMERFNPENKEPANDQEIQENTETAEKQTELEQKAA